ncbi:shikimate kinase [Chitinispirillales bacterium ANBcel5]|uniref:shikimate kinase n=1 Tax=Cellulosispirillum alkaliphilum TaxID=3039283 RepID=UPI002A5479AE|nr:shikimate kinase [Chitinispirillales bacterium ANBcel5]
MNIILIGFASSGKTTTAKALAKLLNYPHLDLDEQIELMHEKKEGKSLKVRQLFSNCGKEGFTKLEHEALKAIAGAENTIISTGGHAPLCANNQMLLKKLGKIIYLRADSQTIIKRMQNKGFPSSIKGGKQGLLEEIRFRNPVYRAISDIIIESDTLSPEQTAQEIIRICNLESQTKSIRR